MEEKKERKTPKFLKNDMILICDRQFAISRLTIIMTIYNSDINWKNIMYNNLQNYRHAKFRFEL